MKQIKKKKSEVSLTSKPLDSGPFLQPAKSEKYYKFCLSLLCLGFGIYLSIIYFGYAEVPNSDFPCFYQTGQEILSFKVPSSFKRGPVVGILQVVTNFFVRDHAPSITAGLMVNAILYPLIFLLLWRVAERIVGRAGIWIALMAIINPQGIYFLMQPIAETTLLFFVLLTIYLILKRSKWCWLLASVTTMVRYEGAALILAAFMMDMIYAENRKDKIKSFGYAVLASVPLGLWMFGTLATGLSDQTHYLNIFFSKDFAKAFSEMKDQTGIVKHLLLIWSVGILPLVTMPYGTDPKILSFVILLSKIIPILAFLFGSVWGLIRKRWDILVLLIFFVPYFLIHAAYPYPIARFHTTIFWIMLLMCWFGLKNIWELIVKYAHISKYIALGLGICFGFFSFFWIASLMPYVPKIPVTNPKLISFLYTALGLAILIFVTKCVLYRGKNFLRELIVLIFISSLIVSNYFILVFSITDGRKDFEFKLLAQWYQASYKPDDKIAVYMAPVVKLFVPEISDSVVALPFADTPEEFIEKCREQGITYVVWATREMSMPKTEGYKMAGLHNIVFLYKTQDIGPYKFVKQIRNRNELVNIFRLVYPESNNNMKPKTQANIRTEQ